MNNILSISLPIGLGDILYCKAQLDLIKNSYSKINISFFKPHIENFRNNNSEYGIFLDELGNLLFSESPFLYHKDQYFDYSNCFDLFNKYRFAPIKPNLKKYLCKGISLNLKKPYIVLTTKVRYLPKTIWNNKKKYIFDILKNIQSKYYFVILGEKEVEMNSEYSQIGDEGVYSIYNDLIENLNAKDLLDLTVQKLGITAPSLKQLQQDSLTLSEAYKTITVGIGGNFCLATSVGNVIGYRTDTDFVGNGLFDNKIYSDAFITKDFDSFISKLLEL